MMKFALSFLITVFFCACGVDTSSSSRETDLEVLSDSDLVVSNPIDPNPIDLGGSTDPDTPNTPDTPDTPVIIVNPSLSDFDTVGAIEDANACNVATYRFVSDASYGGQEDGENGASSSIADGQGLVIRSEYLSQDYLSTWVILYHKSFPTPSDLNLQGVANYTMIDVFSLSYDLAWADESIAGVDNIVYVKSDKSEKPSCYRLTLNTIVGDEIDVQKVYRVRL